MDLAGWLRSLGLERYEASFRENEIDESVLPSLTAEDLKELGVGALGHRRKLLDAIAALRGNARASLPEGRPARINGWPFRRKLFEISWRVWRGGDGPVLLIDVDLVRPSGP